MLQLMSCMQLLPQARVINHLGTLLFFGFNSDAGNSLRVILLFKHVFLVTELELHRAKNATRLAILLNLESRVNENIFFCKIF